MRQAFRFVKHKHELLDWYGLHIVTFNDDGSVKSYIVDPVLWAHSPENILDDLKGILRDVERYPDVLPDDNIPHD